MNVPSFIHEELKDHDIVAERTISGGDICQAMAVRVDGGFSTTFYSVYEEHYPLDRTGYEERKPLYQLYYLLVHLVLFGESYGASVDRILERYAG